MAAPWGRRARRPAARALGAVRQAAFEIPTVRAAYLILAMVDEGAPFLVAGLVLEDGVDHDAVADAVGEPRGRS